MNKNIEFDEKYHTYYYTGGDERQKLPSVTSIAKLIGEPDSLMGWAKYATLKYIKENIEKGKTYSAEKILEIVDEAEGETDRISDRAIDIGNEFHSLIEEYILADIDDNEKPELEHSDDQVQIALNSFNSWLLNNEVEFIDSEFVLYHPKHFYAGTADILARVNGKLYILDLKTSSSIYKKYKLQGAAYTCAMNYASDKEKIDGYGILKFPKEKTSKFDDFFRDDKSELYEDFQTFLGLLKAYKWKN